MLRRSRGGQLPNNTYVKNAQPHTSKHQPGLKPAEVDLDVFGRVSRFLSACSVHFKAH